MVWARPASATTVGGAISSNTTWGAAGSPYVVSSNVTVNPGVTLTIEPGVTVQFPAGGQLSVSGQLLAVGTSQSPISFTSSAASPAPGAWGNVYFAPGSSSTSRIAYASVTYGGASTFYGALRVNGGSPTFDHVTVSASATHGIDLPGGSATITGCVTNGNGWDGIAVYQATASISDTTTSGNSGYGVNISTTSSASLTNVTISGNGGYAIQLAASAQISALTNVTATGNGGNAKNVIAVLGGTTPTNATWRAGLPYTLAATNTIVTVPPNGTLTIEPGAVVRFGSGGQLSVSGKLLAVGTAQSPITFTSSAASPAPGAWGNIYFAPGSSSTSRIAYATVTYGGAAAFYGALRVNGGSPTFDHVTVSASATHGIDLPGGSATIATCVSSGNGWDGIAVYQSTAAISDTTTSGNAGYGINILNASNASLTNVSITGNGGYAIQMAASAQISALTNVTATGNGGDAKNVIAVLGGTTSANAAWRAGLPYTLAATNTVVTVPSNGTLTIDPGAVVRFGPGGQLRVQGKLTAVGTAVAPIAFTSSSASPAPGSWKNIYFLYNSTAGSQIAYATVAYAGGADYGAVVVDGGTPALDHVTVSSSAVNGINVTRGTVTVQGCNVTGNVATGIALWGSTAAANVSSTTVSGNGGRGVNALNYSGVSLADVAITSNVDYAAGIDANSRLTSLANVTATGNGGGQKDMVGVDTGTAMTITNQVWRAGLPYQLSSSTTLTVGGGALLTIDPGVVVRFPPGGQMDVWGKLLAVGTAPSPITFTSATATPGSWRNITLRTAATPGSQIAYANVSYGGAADSGAIVVRAGAPTLDHVTVTGSSSNGVNVAVGSVTLSASQLTTNAGSGLALADGTSASVSDVVSSSNGGFAFLTAASAWFTTFSGITATGNGGGSLNQIGITSGTTPATATWGAALPYAFAANNTSVTVGAGGTLTIEPGAVVLMRPGSRLTVNGRLLAVGTPASRITLTSAQASPIPGSWSYVAIGSGSTGSQIAYADVSYGGGDVDNRAALIASGALTLDHVTVSRSGGHALEVRGGPATVTASELSSSRYCGIYLVAGQLVASDSVFRDNGDRGVLVQNQTSATVTRSSFAGNLFGIAHTQPTSVVAARLNDWGSPTGPGGSGPGGGQTVDAPTEYDPWLVAAPNPAYQIVSATAASNPFDATTTWTLAATSSGTWQVVVKDAAGSTVRMLAATGASPTIVWDGKDEAGALAPDGTYSYLIDVTSGSGVPATTARGLVTRVDMSTFKVTAPSLEIDRSTTPALALGSVLPAAGSQTIRIKQWITPTELSTIRTLISDVPRASGAYTDTWDYRDDAGRLVKDDAYFITSTLTDGTSTQTYDLTSSYYGDVEKLLPTVVATGGFDPFVGKPVQINVTYQRPGWRWVILMPGRSYGGGQNPSTCDPPNICLTQPEAQPSGPATIEWSGTDDTGQLRPDIGSVATIQSRADMGKNAVVLRGTRPQVTGFQVAPRRFDPQAATQNLTFTLSTFQSEPATVTATFVNQATHSTLRTITVPAQVPGPVTLAWDGRGDNGILVTPGLYTVTVTVVDARSNRVPISTQVEVLYR